MSGRGEGRGCRDSAIHHRLLDTLYTEALLLADEARGYFDGGGRAESQILDPAGRAWFSCESLKVTTRLMHVIAWLLTQRAVGEGEIDRQTALEPERRLGPGPASEDAAVRAMPPAARALIEASIDLYGRVARLDHAQASNDVAHSPARSMYERLARSF